jgi:uncharacterized phage-associated protein
MDIGMTSNKELIGNLVIYIANKCKPLYQTKLLKLLYLIDEEAVREKGTPITWLEYNVWKFGPVSKDIYFSKIENANSFDSYFTYVQSNKSFRIVPKKQFSVLEFSSKDIEIIDKVLDLHGKKSADQLIALTHGKDTLWRKKVIEKNIRFSEANTTSIETVDFLDIIKDDTLKKMSYFIAKEAHSVNL